MIKHLIVMATCVLPALARADEFKTIETHVTSQSLVENFGTSLGAAEASGARVLVPIGLDLIKHFEGWEPDAYNDPSGYCTIGYGHLIALTRCEQTDLGEFKGKTLSEREGAALLEKDTRYARISVSELVSNIDLSNEEFSALSSLVFNIGEAHFAKSTMLVLLNSGDKESAAEQFARWVKSKGVVLPGLKTRRACERTLFDKDLTYGSNSKFDDGNCTSFGAAPSTENYIDVEEGE
ncbi:hypothetical protein ELH94_22560 [Rhizobium leguminosarum]|uniref:lysozyme n=1 Tax=Rhizobium leguminosarum TaxID=384 RepID=UPI0010310BF2|nr:lysozyme [Rhizobium leguminosarum]TAX99113.1 hypothetical protein ELH94_22560 [Rhizobium leguminosarum]